MGNVTADFRVQNGTPLVILGGVEYFDVHKTFDCGQSFRFERVESSAHECEYSGVAFGRLVSFAADGDTVYIYNSDREDFERIWRQFLCLDMDYGQIDADILRAGEGSVLIRAAEYGRGIRILRQDAFETVISFIISQNNNIPRIKKIIAAMAEAYGERIDVPDGMKEHISTNTSLYSFPTVARLAALSEDELRALRMGFRAAYVSDAARKIHAGELDVAALEALDTAACIDALCAVKGIGLKVASCAALFGLGKYDAFPIDVWMKRVADKYFSADTVPFGAERFGQYAGIAQQYLFYYERYLGGEEGDAR